MRRAIFTKSDERRKQFLQDFLDEADSPIALYLHPKNRKAQVQLETPCNVRYFAYEDMTKTDEWLAINSLVSDSTALILDNFSRYPKIASEKFKSLYRIEKRLKVKAIADIVPFTLDIQYLYTPFSLLGRDILGYSHYYAFRENYHEADADGNVRFSHDFDLLTDKIAPFSEIDYSAFLCPDRSIIETETTADEALAYQKTRDLLFAAKEFSPQRVVTKLADLIHAFDSRIQSVIRMLPTMKGRTLILTNLSSYAKQAQKACKDAGFDVVATSYQIGADYDFDNCIYLESPIVKSYTKADQHLYKTLIDELTQINDFTQELNRAKRRQTSPQAIPAKECASGGTRENQLALF
jgi:hypothetical protein